MIRVRFAPSPTGYLHIGGLRTALYNYLFARKNNGAFLLRIEDTDRERFVEGATESLLHIFPRVGLNYDEGPKLIDGKLEQAGNVGPYIQSLRLNLYKTHVMELIEKGHAYYCFCSSDELASQRKEQEMLKLPTKYNRHCLKLTKEEIARKLELNEPHVIRMQVPEGESSFNDVVRGKITINHAEVDDQILLKSDGFPTYHLANVVDDHLMNITHVIRAEEWISSTPKHVLLYQMFGWNAPEFAHLPLLLNSDRSKLSKRQGDVATEDYLEKGYLPEALINFVALMGHNPKGDQELYTLNELVELFDLTKVNPSGAVVNFEKLDWMNAQHMKRKTANELADLCQPFLDRAGKSVDRSVLERVLKVEVERMTTLADIVDRVEMYIAQPEYDAQLLVWKKADEADAKAQLTGVQSIMEALQDTTKEGIEATIKAHIEQNGLSNGNVLWPLRVALSGQSQSPGPFELAEALGKEEVLRRIAVAIAKLS